MLTSDRTQKTFITRNIQFSLLSRVSGCTGVTTQKQLGQTTPMAPNITTQPANQTVQAGQTAAFSVVAAGTAPLSYQWEKNNANIKWARLRRMSYTTPATVSG